MSFAVVEVEGSGTFAFDLVDHIGCSQGYVDVVVAVPVHKSVRVRRDFDVVDADVFIFECEVVVGLGGEFHFGGNGLGGQEGGEEAEEDLAFHAGDCSTGSDGIWLTRGAR